MYINCLESSLQIHIYANVILSYYNQILLQMFWVPYCFRSATNIKPDDIMQIVFDKKIEMVDLLFKRMMIMIRCLIRSKKGPLLLFHNCLNVTIMGNVLNFMV